MKSLTHLFAALMVLALLWTATLAIDAGPLLLPIPEASLFAVLLTGLFLLAGPLTGACGVLLVSLARESLVAMPAGRMLFATATVGLLLLHLARLERWSLIGRGMVMSCLAGGLWQLQLGFFQQTQTATTGLNWSDLGRESLSTAVIATGLWLAAAVVLTGLRTVWRETATRPIRFGNQFD